METKIVKPEMIKKNADNSFSAIINGENKHTGTVDECNQLCIDFFKIRKRAELNYVSKQNPDGSYSPYIGHGKVPFIKTFVTFEDCDNAIDNLVIATYLSVYEFFPPELEKGFREGSITTY